MECLEPRSWLAEGLGTFALVFAGTGAIIVNETSGGAIGHAGVALTFGLVVMAMIYAVGHVSGAHLNPAVTLGLAVARRFPWRWAPGYVAAQCAGALVASGLLRWLFPAGGMLGATIPGGGAGQSFILEVVITGLLMLVILGVSGSGGERRPLGGLAVGATVALAALFAGPVSGASMNPARSLAPALVSGHWDGLWIYLLAPAAGAMLAVPLHCVLQPATCCPGPAAPADA